jgi:DNA-binding MurR/RpiR family transcriptional regulator
MSPATPPTNGRVASTYVLERVRNVVSSLSTSELAVARLILERPLDFIDWSAAEVAKQSGTSGATVVRTCRRLGFEGIKDLRLTLARDLGPRLGQSTKAQGRTSELRELFERAAQSIGQMVTKENEGAFRRAVGCLHAANRVLVVSAGPTRILAEDFAFHLRLAGRQADYWSDAMVEVVVASQLTRKDVCVAVSSSGVNSLTVDAAQAARDSGAKVIAVTGFAYSHLADIATITLVASTFDYSTTSQFAINSAGLLLMLRALVIAMTSAPGKGSQANEQQALKGRGLLGRYVYRRMPGNE